MPRGYRYIVLATFGWLALANSQPQRSPKDSQQKTDAKVAKPAPTSTSRPPVQPVNAPKYNAPCKQPQEHDPCDLEAQWKAADAADKAAWWAVVQSILSAAGVVGLVISIHYTRKAVLAAEDATRDAGDALATAARNADAASALASISNEANRRQLRAYLGVESVKFAPAIEARKLTSKVVLRNYGQTPADIVSQSEAGWVGKFPIIDPHIAGPTPARTFKMAPINPGATAHVFIGADMPRGFTSDHDSAFYIYGTIEYRDCYREKHILKYAYRIVGDSLNNSEGAQPCSAGNHAD